MSEILASRLRELRKERRLTQRQVADELHVAQTTIANYENGTRLPDLEKLGQFAVLFQVSIDYLLGKELQILPPAEEPLPEPEDYFVSLKRGQKAKARHIVLRLLKEGLASQEIYQTFMERALIKTGDLWEAGEMAVWQEHLISEIIQNNMALIKGARKQPAKRPKKILCLLPGAESHMIGLRMMGDLLEEQSHQVHFLGNYLPADSVLEAIRTLTPDFVLLSVTMDANLDSAKTLSEQIKRALGDQAPKIIIGGKAFDRLKQPQKALQVHAYCESFTGLMRVIDN